MGAGKLHQTFLPGPEEWLGMAQRSLARLSVLLGTAPRAGTSLLAMPVSTKSSCPLRGLFSCGSDNVP